ncbi:hypothetical protein QJS04_geneDACA018176 [Acorus gramineus]|uniref:Uncharacterized protein n=1 Tax=Acorus gramineus TaxID=55184 RepID=A0AAV9AJX1_ACOGR|nr:hypothetical protein QJS04_geneDACA018176 [Acorus gramineus]
MGLQCEREIGVERGGFQRKKGGLILVGKSDVAGVKSKKKGDKSTRVIFFFFKFRGTEKMRGLV